MPNMQKTPGISGIAGYTKSRDFASPAEMQGNFVDPLHQQWGEKTEPYPWEAFGGAHGPYSPPAGDNEFVDDNEYTGVPAGQIFEDPEGDFTPSYGSHAAPFPKGTMRGDQSSIGPEGTAQQLRQSAEIHGARTNAGASRLYAESLVAQNDEWEGFFNPVQGEDLVAPTPSQISPSAFGFGVNDHVSNSYHKANEYELNTSHRHRRYATGSIPGNSLWLKARGRIMIKSLPHGAVLPVGQNSPFAGDDVMDTYGIDGAILQSAPTQYTAPPTPYVAPAMQTTTPQDWEWY